jgi:hypothetical protein
MQVSSRLVHPAHGGYGAEVQRDKVVAVLRATQRKDYQKDPE